METRPRQTTQSRTSTENNTRSISTRRATDKESESPTTFQTTKRNSAHKSRSVLSSVLQTNKTDTEQTRQQPRGYSPHNQYKDDSDENTDKTTADNQPTRRRGLQPTLITPRRKLRS